MRDMAHQEFLRRPEVGRIFVSFLANFKCPYLPCSCAKLDVLILNFEWNFIGNPMAVSFGDWSFNYSEKYDLLGMTPGNDSFRQVIASSTGFFCIFRWIWNEPRLSKMDNTSGKMLECFLESILPWIRRIWRGKSPKKLVEKGDAQGQYLSNFFDDLVVFLQIFARFFHCV